MGLFTSFRLRLRALFRRRHDQEIRDELRFHVEELAERYRATGLSHREALAAAHRKFGNVTRVQEESHDLLSFRLLEQLSRDVRYGIRMLRKRPGFTAVAVTSLAIGIGSNTAIFSLVDAVVLQDSAYDRPEELVSIYGATPDTRFSTMSYPDYESIRDGTREVFSNIGASVFVLARVELDGQADIVVGQAVSGEYLPLLGVAASHGRVIDPADDSAPGRHPVVMLGHAYWQAAFDGDAEVLGQEIRLGGQMYTVVGVGPPDYSGGLRGVRADLFVPMSMYEALMGVPIFDERGNHPLTSMARLAPGATLPQAEASIAAVTTALDESRPTGWGVGDSFSLISTAEVLIFPSLDTYIRAVAWLLVAVVGLVLLLACMNLASFLLARARDRQHEVAMRLALGASRGALLRQLLTETTLLGLAGGLAGFGLAVWSLGVLENADIPLPFSFRLTLDLSPDWTVFALTMAVSAVAGALLGLVPALKSSPADTMGALRDAAGGGGDGGRRRWRNLLVVTQLTVSLVLLVGAGLFLRSYQQLNAVDPGFGHDPTAIMTVMVPNTRFTEGEGRRYLRRVLERMQTVPGLETVGLIDNMPLDISSSGLYFNVAGHPTPVDEIGYRAERAQVDPLVFDALGIPLRAGRPFRDSDDADAPPVVIINETMAERFWPDGSALGRTIRRAGDDVDLRVVGIVADIKVDSLSESPALQAYLPYSQTEMFNATLVARTSLDPGRAALTMATTGRALDPEMLIWTTSTMDRHLAVSRFPAQAGAVLLSVFSVLALGLAVVGLYGVVSYAVASRAREVGIRMALGASGQNITRLLASDGLRLVLVGTALGLVLSLVASRALTSLLVGTASAEWVAFAGALGLLGATALLASYLPARRASRANPVTALRSD